MAHKKLPKIIYVTWVDEGDPFLSAEKTLESLAVKDETQIVGVYELKELQEVQLEVKSTVKTKRVK